MVRSIVGFPGVQITGLVARRYRVERLVGSGGAADVYEVTGELSGQRVALKRPGSGEDAELAEIVPHVRAQLEMNLAVAKASAGNTKDGTAYAERAMKAMLEGGTAGIILVEHYAKQRFVALKAGDLVTLPRRPAPDHPGERARRPGRESPRRR